MNDNQTLIPAIFEGWHTYQQLLTEAVRPLTPEQLALRQAPELRSISIIALHIIGARARWFYMLMNEGGDEFKELCRWDHPEASDRSAAEIIHGLERTWAGMQEAIGRWTPEQWAQTWPGEDDSEPDTITRQWVIWHLIEHDLHHGGEISLTLGAHGLAAPNL
jgi:uncharacterized damage-inducible protein DinB